MKVFPTLSTHRRLFRISPRSTSLPKCFHRRRLAETSSTVLAVAVVVVRVAVVAVAVNVPVVASVPPRVAAAAGVAAVVAAAEVVRIAPIPAIGNRSGCQTRESAWTHYQAEEGN